MGGARPASSVVADPSEFPIEAAVQVPGEGAPVGHPGGGCERAPARPEVGLEVRPKAQPPVELEGGRVQGRLQPRTQLNKGPKGRAPQRPGEAAANIFSHKNGVAKRQHLCW